jgi:hypothetical protein
MEECMAMFPDERCFDEDEIRVYRLGRFALVREKASVDAQQFIIFTFSYNHKKLFSFERRA